jgi:hypothetical protein
MDILADAQSRFDENLRAYQLNEIAALLNDRLNREVEIEEINAAVKRVEALRRIPRSGSRY